MGAVLEIKSKVKEKMNVNVIPQFLGLDRIYPSGILLDSTGQARFDGFFSFFLPFRMKGRKGQSAFGGGSDYSTQIRLDRKWIKFTLI